MPMHVSPFPLKLMFSFSLLIWLIYVYIHKYINTTCWFILCGLCIHDLRANDFQLYNHLQNSFLRKTNFPFLSSHRFPVILYLGMWATEISNFHTAFPLSSFRPCLENHVSKVSRVSLPTHFQNTQSHSRLPGPLGFTIIPHLLSQHSLNFRCSNCVLNVSTGPGGLHN